MKRSAVRVLVGVQTVLMVAFGWTAAYLGRDEFRLVADSDQARVPDHAASTAAVEPGGLPAVRMSAVAQRSVGIEVASPIEPIKAGKGGESGESGEKGKTGETGETGTVGRGAAVVVGSADMVDRDAQPTTPGHHHPGRGTLPTDAGWSTPLTATVADLQPVLELRGRLQAAQADVAAARAATIASVAERTRTQALYDDDRNASQRALDEARAAAAAATARERGAETALASLDAVARAAWGAELAAAMRRPGDAGPLAPLFAGKSVLLRVVLRSDDPAAAPARLSLRQGGAAGGTTTARRLAAVPGDAAAPGRHVLYLAPAAGLAVGMRVTALGMSASPGAIGSQRDNAVDDGRRVPATAIVWHAGQPWVYVRESASATSGRGDDDADGNDAAPLPSRPSASAARGSPTSAPIAPANPIAVFRRHAVPDARRVDAQWLLPDFDRAASVVVRGAQVLLSEELKSQIGDEND